MLQMKVPKMNTRRIVSIALLAGLSGCATLQTDSSTTQLKYHPLLDRPPEAFPYEWEDDPEFPPLEPLPIIPLKTK